MRAWAVPTLVAAVVTVVPAAAQAAVVAHWTMDETAGAPVMRDSAPLGGANDGAIFNVRTGDPGLVSGSAYFFDGASSYVEVPDANSLDPGAGQISLTATVRTVNGPMPDDSYDLVRKGVVTTTGGYWKMEIKRASNASVGRLNCVFKGVMPDGTKRTAKRVAPPDIVDGRIHTLQCVRTSGSIQAVVDGTVYSTTGATGSIANNQSVVMGAKLAGDDVLKGTLDEVIVDIG